MYCAVVYCHTNTRSGKRYVGFGMGADGMSRRWDEHLKNARLGSPLLFHRALRKYGTDCWAHEQLERVEHSDEECCFGLVCRAEIAWIAFLQAFVRYYPRRGYNMTRGGDGMLGYRHTEASLKKNADAHTGRVYSNDVCQQKSRSMLASARVRRRPVLQLTRTGEVVALHSSVGAAATAVGKPLAATLVSRCCNGGAATFHGFVWRFEDGIVSIKPTKAVHGARVLRAIEQLDMSGRVIASYGSIAAAGRAIGRPGAGTSIRLCCRGKRRTAYGFRWRFISEWR